MKYKKPVAFNYVKAMKHIEELKVENRELKEENQKLRANLGIKERIERAEI